MTYINWHFVEQSDDQITASSKPRMRPSYRIQIYSLTMCYAKVLKWILSYQSSIPFLRIRSFRSKFLSINFMTMKSKSQPKWEWTERMWMWKMRNGYVWFTNGIRSCPVLDGSTIKDDEHKSDCTEFPFRCRSRWVSTNDQKTEKKYPLHSLTYRHGEKRKYI